MKLKNLKIFFLITLIFISFTTASSFASNNQKTTNDKNISFDFDGVDIKVFIKFISELTGKNFIVDEKVKGKVTVISPTKISTKEAYRVFETILEVHGYSMVKAGKLTKIVPSVEANRMNIRTDFNENKLIGKVKEEIVTQIIPLKYADVSEIKGLFAPLISRNGMILAYNKTNTIFITDVYSNITRLLKILKKIDVEGAGKKLSIYPLKYATSTKLVKILSVIFKSTKASTNKNYFIADERANTIIAISTKKESTKINQIINKLDKMPKSETNKVNIYYLKNARAEDVAKVLQSLIKKSTDKDSKISGGVISARSRITLDKTTNSLVIAAEQDDYLVIKAVIEKLDVPRDMVYIESLIVEVDVDKSFELGGSLVGGNQSGSKVYGMASLQGSSASSLTAGLGTTTASTSSGFSLGLFDETIKIGNLTYSNLAGVISAYKSKTGYNILSTPQILTLNNEEASINVGDNIPYSTTAASSTDGSYSYEYKDVGVTLTVTPQISKDRKIRLKIKQEVKSVSSSTTSTGTTADVRLPTTKVKTIDTSVVVNDGATVVIGGLIGKEKTITKSAVPCLGSIPILGWLFKSTSEKTNKSNLYVFLSPRIISNEQEARALYEEKKLSSDEMKKETIDLFTSNSGEDDKNDEKQLKVKYVGKGNNNALKNDKEFNTPQSMPLKKQKYNSDSIDSFIESIGQSEYGLGEEIP